MSPSCYCDGMKEGFALCFEVNRLFRKIFYMRDELKAEQIQERKKLQDLELELEKISNFAGSFLSCEANPFECKNKAEYLFGLFKTAHKKVEALKMEIEIALIVSQ
jgi:hypothetical protein